MSWDKERIAQIQLPDPADDDSAPSAAPGRARHTRRRGIYSFVSRWLARDYP